MKLTSEQKNLISELKKKYKKPTIPPCPVCGGPRDRLAAITGGTITYCCSSEEAQAIGRGLGREEFDKRLKHFSDSKYAVYNLGDRKVLELCELVESLAEKKLSTGS